MAASISASFGQEHECNNDIVRCQDGSFVGRNPEDGCGYFACPTAMANPPSARQPTPLPTPAVVSMASSLHGKYNAAPLECAVELFECANGHYVGRDPDDGCNWYPCNYYEPPTTRPTPRPTNYSLNALSSGGCANDLLRCIDGSFVGRDVDDMCEFFKCPQDHGDERGVSMQQLSSPSHVKEAEIKIAPVQYSGVSVHRKKRNSRSR